MFKSKGLALLAILALSLLAGCTPSAKVVPVDQPSPEPQSVCSVVSIVDDNTIVLNMDGVSTLLGLARASDPAGQSKIIASSNKIWSGKRVSLEFN